jgi:uncharacterized protein (UPF0548 family)
MTMGNKATSENKVVSAYGPDNLQIEESPDKVTITFDPRVVIGTGETGFKSGKNKVASTGAFEKFRKSGVRIMLHVGTIVG